MISGMVSGAFAGAAMSMSGNPMFCFVAGTTVLTTLGKKAIETIQVGDTIPSIIYSTSSKCSLTSTINCFADTIYEFSVVGKTLNMAESPIDSQYLRKS